MHKVLVQAEEGRTVNYGETKLADGSYLGVSMMSHAEQQADAESTREANYQKLRRADDFTNRRNNEVADESERIARNY